MQTISYKKYSPHAHEHAKGFLLLKNMSMFSETILTSCWSPEVWRDGVRLKANFIESHFLALDFDTPGEESMHEIDRALADHKRIIATTKSHMKLKNGVTCERFRLIIPWSQPITDLDTYIYNLQHAYKRFPWADRACINAGRFYYPSKEIVSLDRDSEYAWEVRNYVAPEKIVINPPKSKKIPGWCLAFINDGMISEQCGSRSMKIFSVARELYYQGFDSEFVRFAIKRSPISFQGIGLDSILKSAERKAVEDERRFRG